MHHLHGYSNQDIKRRLNEYSDSTVHTAEYRSKPDQTVKPQWA